MYQCRKAFRSNNSSYGFRKINKQNQTSTSKNKNQFKVGLKRQIAKPKMQNKFPIKIKGKTIDHL